MAQGACCWVVRFEIFCLLVAKREGCGLSKYVAAMAETCSELPGGQWGRVAFLPWKTCEVQALLLGYERRDEAVYLEDSRRYRGRAVAIRSIAWTGGHAQDLCNWVSVRLAGGPGDQTLD